MSFTVAYNEALNITRELVQRWSSWGAGKVPSRDHVRRYLLNSFKKSLLIYQAIKNPETSEALLPDLSKQVASGNHKNEQAVLRKKD